MRKSMTYLGRVSLIALASVASAAFAQQSYEYTTCRAGTLTSIAQTEGANVLTLDHRGVNDPADGGQFGGWTQRCIGVLAVINGKQSGNGWCKSVDPKTGDWTLVDWTAGEKPGAGGTWAFRLGTGKWKGVTGGGTYTQTGPTRPVEAGTYQNCVRIKGTVSVPN